MTTLILTVVGPDRPGLVSTLAATVAAYDGNWLTSRMADLAGQFAGIVEVSVEDSRSDALIRALGELEGLRVAAVSGATGSPPPATWRVHVVGDDRPGIVHQVAGVLAAAGISIEELTTSTSEAPMSGGLLFRADAVLSGPARVDLTRVRAALEELAGELMVDLEAAE